MGFLLATSLPMALWLLGSRPVLRPLVVAIIGLLGTALLFSFARGALFGLAVGAVWQVVVERRHVRLLLLGALAAGLAALFVVHSNSSQVSNGLRLKQHVAAANVSTRLEAWGAASRIASDHPLLGIGPGNFRDVYYAATGRPPGSLPRLAVVHNAYLDIAAELGVVALLLFLAYLALAFTRLSRCVRSNVGLPGFASVVRTSLVVASVGSLTLSEQYFPQFWLFGGLATALWAEQSWRARAAAAGGRPGPFEPAVAAESPTTSTYDSPVNDRRVDERDRRVRDQLAAARAQHERLKRVSDDLREREGRLELARAELHRQQQAHRDEEARLAAFGTELAAREHSVRELERQARARSHELDTRGAELSAQAQRIAEYGPHAGRDAVAAERLKLEEQRASLARRRKELAARESRLRARDERIMQRERAVAVRAAEIEAGRSSRPSESDTEEPSGR